MFQEICNSSQNPETCLKIQYLKDHYLEINPKRTFIIKVGKSNPPPLAAQKKQKTNIIH